MSTTNSLPRRAALAALVACAFTGVAGQAQAQAWPTKPIRFVVPFGPGGANDIVARAVAEGASKQLGQTIIIENKPGAGSLLGSDIVAKS
ncbi:Bug family tripartite tricarboxylate transporter substrate binding protein, partial [Azohydromonas lata]